MSRMTKILIVAALGFIAVLHITQSVELNANDANVCPTFGTSVVNVVRSYQESYAQIYYTSCTDITDWFRCTRHKVAYRTNYRAELETQQVVTYECCLGYRQVGQQCQPICTLPCDHGTCSGLGTCVCDPGYTGIHCEFVCANHMWGPNCNHQCTCQNGASCNPETGVCTCTPGYAGISCSNPCLPGTFGSGCQSSCFCQNGAECNHVTGACMCAGYEPCLCIPNDSGQTCTCQNGGQCHHETGTCTCTPGYTGEVCGEMCPRLRYGQDCQQHCQCFNQAHCNHVDGTCVCAPGYYGPRCEYP